MGESFTCLGPKCPSSCCKGLGLDTYKNMGIRKFPVPVKGTVWNKKIVKNKIPNRFVSVTKSQMNKFDFYPPLFIAKTPKGIGFYGNQMSWKDGACTRLKGGLCIDYENRPLECKATPFSYDGEKLAYMTGCPFIKNIGKGNEVFASLDYHRAAYAVWAFTKMLFERFVKDNVKELYFVHPESTEFPFKPDFIVTIDVKDNKIVIDGKTVKKEKKNEQSKVRRWL